MSVDNNLKHILKKQIEISRPLSEEIINCLENPVYSNGKRMKCGDTPLHVLEIRLLNAKKFYIKLNSGYSGVVDESSFSKSAEYFEDEKFKCDGTVLKMILFPSEDINDISENYWYAGGDEKSTRVIKR